MTTEALFAFGTLLLAQNGGGGAPATTGNGLSAMLPFMVLIFFVFYFMVLRPENKRRSEHEKMRSELKKNDKVVTIGGIYGTVVNAQQGSDEVTIKVDESSNTKLRITRTAIQTVLTNKEGSEKTATSK